MNEVFNQDCHESFMGEFLNLLNNGRLIAIIQVRLAIKLLNLATQRWEGIGIKSALRRKLHCTWSSWEKCPGLLCLGSLFCSSFDLALFLLVCSCILVLPNSCSCYEDSVCYTWFWGTIHFPKCGVVDLLIANGLRFTWHLWADLF